MAIPVKKLVVFDLDLTLLSIDSTRYLYQNLTFRHPVLIALAVARRLGVLSRQDFAERAHKAAIPQLKDAQFVSDHIDECLRNVVHEQQLKASAYRAGGAFALLLSSAPCEYVSLLAGFLGFDCGVGSHWISNEYVHMFGKNKIIFIEKNYPQATWSRSYAISDSDSDLALLALFESAELVSTKAFNRDVN